MWNYKKQFDKCKNEAEIRVFPKYTIYKHFTLFVVYNIVQIQSVYLYCEKTCPIFEDSIDLITQKK